ncbi:MAG: arylsulfatase [Gemmataceae bacterium]
MVGTALVVLAFFAAPDQAASRPNIVILLADDMGFSDIGCYGSEIRTPHLDSLAEKGVRFTQFYNTARCCPTRASLLTGLYAHQAGVGHMVNDNGLPGYRGRLNDRCLTFAEVLRPAGYRTYLSGKWHVGEQKGSWPVDRGFDRCYSLISGGTNYWRLDKGRILARDSEAIRPPENWYVTDALTDHAVEFLQDHAKQHADKPFVLYVPYTAPHWPLHAHPEDIARYKDTYLIGWDKLRQQRLAKMKKLGLVADSVKLTPRDPKVPAWDRAPNQADAAHRMAVYAAQIECMDRGIGKIIAQLRANKCFDNTLILFLSDNGGCAELIDRGTKGVPAGGPESFLSYGIGWANASNTPFRRYKHWVHEGGIRSPLIAHWPAGIRKPGLVNSPAHVIDIMATCVDLAGANYPGADKATPLEGQSLRPLLEGKAWKEHEALFWEHEGNLAVRMGDWKLVALHKGPWELYNLATDPEEMIDLSAKETERTQAMIQRYEAWAKRAQVRPWEEVQKSRPKKE